MEHFTYADAVEHALDYLGGTPDEQAVRDCRRCVLQAYREVTNARTWSYLIAQGRILTSAPYETGTVAYDHTGGTYERSLILTDGVWPSWAGPGAHVRIGDVTSSAAERRSDLVLTLTEEVNPGADIDLTRTAITALDLSSPVVVTSVAHGLATGDRVVVEGVVTTLISTQVEGLSAAINGAWAVTVLTADTFELDDSDGTTDESWTTTGTWREAPTTTYTLYRDVYLLPEDFVAQDTALYEGNFGGLVYTQPGDWLWEQRSLGTSGTPHSYVITGDARFPGRMVLKLAPYPDQARTVDFMYLRRPRPLRIEAYSAGTVTTSAGSAVVAGNGTAFDATMAGSVLRLGTAARGPTSWIGAAPPAVEVVILEVVSATELRVAEAVAAVHSVVKYTISDPLDVETGVMQSAVLRSVEKHLHIARMIRDKPDAFAGAAMALRDAQAADSRSYQARGMGGGRGRGVAIKDMPADFS